MSVDLEAQRECGRPAPAPHSLELAWADLSVTSKRHAAGSVRCRRLHAARSERRAQAPAGSSGGACAGRQNALLSASHRPFAYAMLLQGRQAAVGWRERVGGPRADGHHWWVSGQAAPSKADGATVCSCSHCSAHARPPSSPPPLAATGPSGAGKSTLLNALACRLDGGALLEGKARLNGAPYSRAQLKRLARCPLLTRSDMCRLHALPRSAAAERWAGRLAPAAADSRMACDSVSPHLLSSTKAACSARHPRRCPG